MPEVLSRTRRLLRARARAGQGDVDDALGLILREQGDEADRLRVDIARRAGRWDIVAEALSRLIGPPPVDGEGIADPDTLRLILNRAVALALNANANGLAQLRREFGPAMAQTTEAETFRLLTRPPDPETLLDLQDIRRRVDEVDLFNGFLESYRAE